MKHYLFQTLARSCNSATSIIYNDNIDNMFLQHLPLPVGLRWFKRTTSVGLKSAIAMAAEVPAANSRLNHPQSLGPKMGFANGIAVLLPQLENLNPAVISESSFLDA